MVKICFLCISFSALFSFAQKPAERKGPLLNLTQKGAAELVLKQGLRSKEVNYKYQALALKPFEALAPYDWSILLESGTEKDRTESSSTYGRDPEVDRLRSNLTLSKSFITGTT